MIKEIWLGDCLGLMANIKTGSIDLILCDLPYGVTGNSWDTVIPFAPLWKQYERIIKPNGAIILTAQDKFTARLIMSNEKLHRYNLIWEKSRPGGFLNANRRPLRSHEDILIFYKKLPTYNPQKSRGKPNNIKDGEFKRVGKNNNNYGKFKSVKLFKDDLKFPTSVIKINSLDPTKIIHPTEKPVALFEYLIKTYSNSGDLVLDNCAGSGTTGEACIYTGRQFILIEKELQYFEIIKNRIAEIDLL